MKIQYYETRSRWMNRIAYASGSTGRYIAIAAPKDISCY